MNSRDLVNFLKSNQIEADLIDRLKIVYRPLYCPYDKFLDLINEDSRVFDIGCGSGHFCLLTAEFTPAKVIYGIEILENLVKNAKMLLKKYSDKKEIGFEQYDGINLPDKIAAYNTVFLIDVLHHMPKKQHSVFLKNLYQKMTPNSRLIVKDIDDASRLVFVNKLHDLIFSHQITQEMKMSDTKMMIKKIGFKILSESKERLLYCPSYTLVLVK